MILFIHVFVEDADRSCVSTDGGRRGVKRKAVGSGLTPRFSDAGSVVVKTEPVDHPTEASMNESEDEEEYQTLEADAMEWASNSDLRTSHAQLVLQLQQNRARTESARAAATYSEQSAAPGATTASAVSTSATNTEPPLPNPQTEETEPPPSTSPSLSNPTELSPRDSDTQSWVRRLVHSRTVAN